MKSQNEALVTKHKAAEFPGKREKYAFFWVFFVFEILPTVLDAFTHHSQPH